MSFHSLNSLTFFESASLNRKVCLRKHSERLVSETAIVTTTPKYSLSFLKFHEITENSPVIDPKKLGELPKTVENIRYTLLTHALETKMLDTDDWRRFGLQILGGF